MYEKYLGSEKHKELCRKNCEKGKVTLERKTENRKLEYNENPVLCLNCEKELDYSHRHNKFCSKSCSASFNNNHRTCKKYELSEKGLESIRNSNRKNQIKKKKCISFYIQEKTKELEEKTLGLDLSFLRKKDKIIFETKIEYDNCKNCSKLFVKRKRSSRKSCSSECSIHLSTGERKYINGKRKNIYYFNKWMNKEVLLESSWEDEFAKFLDKEEIEWIRPKYLKWVDSKDKERLYYPDFYLPKYNLYVDPKNPWCLKNDEEKLKFIAERYKIIYGDIKIMKQNITMILNKEIRRSP